MAAIGTASYVNEGDLDHLRERWKPEHRMHHAVRGCDRQAKLMLTLAEKVDKIIDKVEAESGVVVITLVHAKSTKDQPVADAVDEFLDGAEFHCSPFPPCSLPAPARKMQR